MRYEDLSKLEESIYWAFIDADKRGIFPDLRKAAESDKTYKGVLSLEQKLVEFFSCSVVAGVWPLEIYRQEPGETEQEREVNAFSNMLLKEIIFDSYKSISFCRLARQLAHYYLTGELHSVATRKKRILLSVDKSKLKQ